MNGKSRTFTTKITIQLVSQTDYVAALWRNKKLMELASDTYVGLLLSERGFFYRSLIPQVVIEGHSFVDSLSTPSNFPPIKNNILDKD